MLWILIPVSCIILFFAITHWTYMVAFHSPKDHDTDPYQPIKGKQYEPVWDQMLLGIQLVQKEPFESVHITSYDGTKLFGRYYHRYDDCPIQIIFHGYRSPAVRDGSGGSLLALKGGRNVLIVDQRAHGKSDGHVISFGIRERRDCLSWIVYVTERFGPDTPIILSGISMGAATVLMAADLELPANVKCIVADCPYSTPVRIIQKVCADLKYPVKLTKPFLYCGASMFGGFDLNESSAVEAVRHCNIPILLIHGDDDRFVPCEMSKEIFAAGNDIRLEIFPGAGHGLSYLTDKSRYEQVTTEFINSALQSD